MNTASLSMTERSQVDSRQDGRTPLVSVVMPVLNPHPTYFPDAVRSVVQQTLRDFELIIIEDPSPTCAAAFLTALPDSRIRHLQNSSRSSLVEQLNQGIALARSPWIARMDADDLAVPDRLQKQMDYLAAHPRVDVMGSQLAILSDGGVSLGYRAYPLEHEAIARAMLRFCPLAHPSVVMRRDLVLAAGGYRHFPRAEDYELWCRLATGGAIFGNHPEPLVRYRLHTGSAKSVGLREQLRNTLAVKRAYYRGRMKFGDRIRYWAEQLLLFLPPPLVLRLFVKYQFQDRLPAETDRPALVV
jgi:glycosyltransferase involved in cell wall biosynthesis